MKRFVTVYILALACAHICAAQNSGLVGQLAGDGSLTCRFSLTGSSLAGSLDGNAWVQGDCYRIEADSFLIICNGKTRWIYNSASDELVVEHNNLSFMNNPVEKLADGSYRMVIESVEGAGASLSVTAYNLKRQKEKYPFEYFLMDPEKISLDTIVTDLR